MRMPGFSAESSITGGRDGRSRRAFQKTVSGVYPAMMIQIDGMDYCEGEVTDWGVQCYGSGSGGSGPVDVVGNRNFAIQCRASCRRRCGGRTNTPCYRDCVADC
jgi:hypothetical protein